MHNNGQCYIWIPTCLSLSTLDEQAVNIVNTVHKMIGKPLVTTSSPNPYILALNDLDMGGAPFTRDKVPGVACCGPIVNLDYLGLDYVSLIVTFGSVANTLYPNQGLFGDIESMEVYFEFDDPDEECPLSPGTTWRNWMQGAANTEPVEIDGKWYRSNADYSAVQNSGSKTNASTWVPYRNSGGIVLTSGQFKALQNVISS